MRIQINGEDREVEENISLPQLVAILSLKAEQIAIELNRNVVRRAQWENTRLQGNDKIEIVHFVGGGCKRYDPRAAHETTLTTIRVSSRRFVDRVLLSVAQNRRNFKLVHRE